MGSIRCLLNRFLFGVGSVCVAPFRRGIQNTFKNVVNAAGHVIEQGMFLFFFKKKLNRVLKYYHDVGFVDVTPFTICGEYSNDRTTRKYVFSGFSYLPVHIIINWPLHSLITYFKKNIGVIALTAL